MNPSFFHPHISPTPLLILILGLIILIQSMFHLPELPPFNPFLYLFVICGTASQRKWSAYHVHIHLRLLCCSYIDVHLSVFYLLCVHV